MAADGTSQKKRWTSRPAADIQDPRGGVQLQPADEMPVLICCQPTILTNVLAKSLLTDLREHGMSKMAVCEVIEITGVRHRCLPSAVWRTTMMSCVQCDTGPYRSLRAMTEPVVPGENGELVGTSQARAAQ